MGTSINLEQLARKLSREEARFHRETVADLLRRPNLTFPGAQPVSFARKHLRELEQRDYYVAEKTDGIRCLMFLTQLSDADGTPFEIQYLIDRRNDYYQIERGYLHLPKPGLFDKHKKRQEPFALESWHVGTVIDGELVKQTLPGGREQLTFLMFDLLALNSENLTQQIFDKRLGKLEQFIYAPWKAFAQAWPVDAEAQPFQLKMKRPEFGYGVEKMFKQIIPELPHVNDGLIFTCRDTPYVAGTDPHIVKWKPPHENTIDFRLQLCSFPLEEDDEGTYEDFDQKPEVELLVWHGDREGGYKKFSNLYLTDQEWEAMKDMKESFDWRIIECWREAETGRWRPKLEPNGTPRFRDDKEHANHDSVVTSVLESIEDAVTEEELLAAKDRLRDAWKARERRKKEEQAVAQRQEMEQRRRQEAAKAQQANAESKRRESVDETKDDDQDDGPGYVD